MSLTTVKVSGVTAFQGGGGAAAAAVAPVLSVAGRRGDVVLSTADIGGLDDALDAKADTSTVSTLSGTVSALASTVADHTDELADKADAATTATALASKADLGIDGKVVSNQLPAGTGGATNFIPTYASLTAMRAAAPADYATFELAMLAGRDGAGTPGQGLFRWLDFAADLRSIAPDDNAYIIKPDSVSIGTAGRLVRELDGGRLTPQHCGAVGDFVRGSTGATSAANWNTATNDTAAIALLFTICPRWGLTADLGSSGYLLRGHAPLPVINRPFTIQGNGMGVAMLAAHPDDFTGPVIQISELLGLNNLPTGRGGMVIDDVLIYTTRKRTNGVDWVPRGSMHGIVAMDRVDRFRMRGVTIEGFRGWGFCWGYGFSQDITYMREWQMEGNRIRDCACGEAFAALEMYGGPTTESTNNGQLFGFDVVFSRGPNFRLWKQEGPKPFQHVTFTGGMSHGMSEVIAEADEDGIVYANEACVVFDGEVNNINLVNWSFNASRDDQWQVHFRNRSVRRVVVPTGQTVALQTLGAGNLRARVTLPALPTRVMPDGGITTVQGRPDLIIAWPSHGLALWDFVTFDELTGTPATTRTVRTRDWNGLNPRLDGRVVEIPDANTVIVRFNRGFGNATGAVNLSAVPSTERTIKATHGVQAALTGTSGTIGFDTVRGEKVYRMQQPGVPGQNLIVGGAEIGNPYAVRQFVGNFTTMEFDLPVGETPTSAETVLLPEGYVITIGAGARGPVNCSVSGNGTSGDNGILIEAGAFLRIDLPIATGGTDLQVTSGITGPVLYTAAAAEGGPAYNIIVDPSVRSLVRPAASNTSPIISRREPRGIIGLDPYNHREETHVWREFSGLTAQELTLDGAEPVASARNLALFDLPHAFDMEIWGRASVLPSTTGTESASWKVHVTGRWAGGALPVIETVNGDAALVAVATTINTSNGLPPSIVSPGATNADDCRLFLAPYYDSGTGEATIVVLMAGPAGIRFAGSADIRRLVSGGYR